MSISAGDLVADVFGGGFLVNAVPHLVSGLLGRAFQSPFASPPGRGLSSARVNVAWGFANLVVAWVLLARVGTFDVRATGHVAALAAGALAIGMMSAHHFGRLHGGDAPGRR